MQKNSRNHVQLSECIYKPPTYSKTRSKFSYDEPHAVSIYAVDALSLTLEEGSFWVNNGEYNAFLSTKICF